MCVEVVAESIPGAMFFLPLFIFTGQHKGQGGRKHIAQLALLSDEFWVPKMI